VSVDPSDWQCGAQVTKTLRCTKALYYGSHIGPCEHEHDYERCVVRGEDRGSYCGCDPTVAELAEWMLGPVIVEKDGST
jgi:hypothetical protein